MSNVNFVMSMLLSKRGMKEMSIIPELLNTMNVPENRKDISDMANVRWILRNIRIQNADNPQLPELIEKLVSLHKEVIGRDPFVL